ncbi:MAG: hypothetical protein AAGJ87_07100 [Pseudomonadota bacterium]
MDTFLPGAALYANLAALKSLWGPIAVVVFVVAPAVSRTARARWAALSRGEPVLIAIAAIPLVWLELLSNHSQIHAAFTHLNFAVAGFLSLLVFTGAAFKGTDWEAWRVTH